MTATGWVATSTERATGCHELASAVLSHKIPFTIRDLTDPNGVRDGSAGIDLGPDVRDGDAGAVEQRLLSVLRLASQGRRIDRDAPTVTNDGFAGDEHIANRPSVGAPDQLQPDVATR